MEIVFEDENLLVLNKPAGLAVQAKNGESVQTLFPDFYIVHRLDQRVSGLLVLAKNAEVAAVLSSDFQTKNVEKWYWAVVKSKPSIESGSLVHWLDKKAEKAVVSENEIKGFKKAVLEFRNTYSSEKYHLLEIRLLSGRFHQIRAQLSFIGSPIVGDLKYGFPRNSLDGSIFLHAFRLEFCHPVSGAALRFELKRPVVWERFGL